MSSRFFALLVNPRDGEFFEAVFDEYTRVDVLGLKSGATGRGFLSDDSLSEEVVEANMMRAETSHGVSKPGKGIGTVLYTGLCCLAAWNIIVKIWRLPVTGPGVCSYDVARSPSAARWWARMHKLGITKRTPGLGVDTYAFGDAVEAHLVVALVQPTVGAEKLIEVPRKGMKLIDPEAFAGADFAKVPDKATLEVLLHLGEDGGVPRTTLARLAGEYEEAKKPAKKRARKNPGLGWERLP